ncbi:dimethyladenosine transferase 2, mitochondrial [Vanessa atalanta]|uniref:dimethyladenosine transferase 2, mitochondrial n=1 Tax=Vanessa atalanta TaxID=42275 RepID=UPI001FCDEB72|nr:dimethyladenosine transferase 2, mitochondrial [Vanessa atalanta]
MFVNSKCTMASKITFRLLKTPIRLCHKTNKNVEKLGPKLSQDVVKYLETSPEYKNIINVVPKNLLRKYKSPETMYLINHKTAKEITETLVKYLRKDAPVVEVNPGFGFLTRELLRCQPNRIYLYESSNHFVQFLNDIKTQHPDRIKYKIADFFGMWKLAFQDKMDQGNRIEKLLEELATDDNDRILSIVGAMPSLSFVKHLINTIVFHNATSHLGRPDLYIVMPGHYYEFLADSSVQMNKHKSVPSLFQLLFDYEVLNKVPKVHFLPWTYTSNTQKISVMDDFCLYLVKITQKTKLPCLPSDLPLLWYFFKRHTFSSSTRIIPMLEQWIPGCGVWLITGQDPPDTNKELSPGEDDAKLPHMTIFTEFGDLNLKQKITIFKRFISWPEFEQCPFRVTVENNLPKFASQINDDDDGDNQKHIIVPQIDENETSDTETLNTI